MRATLMSIEGIRLYRMSRIETGKRNTNKREYSKLVKFISSDISEPFTPDSGILSALHFIKPHVHPERGSEEVHVPIIAPTSNPLHEGIALGISGYARVLRPGRSGRLTCVPRLAPCRSSVSPNGEHTSFYKDPQGKSFGSGQVLHYKSSLSHIRIIRSVR